MIEQIERETERTREIEAERNRRMHWVGISDHFVDESTKSEARHK